MKKQTLFATGMLMTLTTLVAGLVPSFAAEESFEMMDSEFKLNVPKGWQVAEELYGLPLAILGPEEEEGRALISVVPTGMSDVKLDPKKFGDNKAYQKGRKDWLSRQSGKAIEFFPYKNTKWGESDVHQFGFKYELNGKQFVENSYYVVCKSKLFHLKSLVSTGQDQTHGNTINDSIRSFSCK